MASFAPVQQQPPTGNEVASHEKSPPNAPPASLLHPIMASENTKERVTAQAAIPPVIEVDSVSLSSASLEDMPKPNDIIHPQTMVTLTVDPPRVQRPRSMSAILNDSITEHADSLQVNASSVDAASALKALSV